MYAWLLAKEFTVQPHCFGFSFTSCHLGQVSSVVALWLNFIDGNWKEACHTSNIIHFQYPVGTCMTMSKYYFAWKLRGSSHGKLDIKMMVAVAMTAAMIMIWAYLSLCFSTYLPVYCLLMFTKHFCIVLKK